MDSLAAKVLCMGCDKYKKIVEASGSMDGVDYVVLKSRKQYKVVDNPNISWDNIMQNRDKFIDTYVPRFGKYELERFVGHKIMEALFITKDMTSLLNSELLCDDSPYNITRVSSDKLKERLLKCFDIMTEDGDNTSYVEIMFKWKPYEELEE